MRILDTFLNLLFPPTCGFCGKFTSNYICSSCLFYIQSYKHSNTNIYSKKHFYFQKHFYLFKYESLIREKLIQYKFQDKAYLYKTFAKLFIEDENFSSFIKNYNCITCVPLHKKRFKVRGYNQSELIAKEIAKYFNIPYCKNLLVKKKNIVAQSTLNKEERHNNIKNSFAINPKLNTKKPLGNIFPNSLNNLKIAIFDDIFTTGSTANECAKIIQTLNPSEIGIFTIAKD